MSGSTYVERVFVLSFYHAPVHVRELDAREFKYCTLLDVTYSQFGMIIDLAGLKNGLVSLDNLDMPEWFEQIARLALREGCSFVLFDYDEEEHPDLPVYEGED